MTGGSEEPDEPDYPVQPVMYAETCELIDPAELYENTLLYFDNFNILTSSSDIGVMINVPDGEVGILIEENSSLYRFTLINGGESVSPSLSDRTHSWYITVTNHNYTELYIPNTTGIDGSKFNFDFTILQYYEVPKDELILNGLPVN